MVILDKLIIDFKYFCTKKILDKSGSFVLELRKLRIS